MMVPVFLMIRAWPSRGKLDLYLNRARRILLEQFIQTSLQGTKGTRDETLKQSKN